MLLLWARVNLEAMVVKRYFIFLEALALLKPHHQVVWFCIQDTHGGESYTSAEMQLVYPTASAEVRSCEKFNRGITSPSLVIIPNMMRNGCLVFITLGISCGNRESTCFCLFTIGHSHVSGCVPD